MIVKDFYFPEYDWRLRCYFALDAYYIEDIMQDLYNIGIDERSAERAYRSLRKNDLNTGLCYSNFRNRESLIVTALTSNAREMADSWTHEISHCATHIATHLGIDLKSEEYCYIVGDIAYKTFPYVEHLLCDNCRQKESKIYECNCQRH